MTTDSELRRRRAASFGSQAAAYAEHRPDYPAAAVRWALEPVAGPDGDGTDGDGTDGAGPDGGGLDGLRVLDLAAGTGKLTAVLHGLGAAVTAVEPDPEMLAELHHRLPGTPAFSGTAEQIPLPDGAVDAVVVGQAFHWFEPEQALPEIARVLRPGGVLAALWNDDDDRVNWVAGFVEVSRSRYSTTSNRWFGGIAEHAAYEPVERREFAHSQRRSRESLAATVATHSHVLLLPEDERAQLLARVRGYLVARPETRAAEFEVPMRTLVERAVRHPEPRPADRDG